MPSSRPAMLLAIVFAVAGCHRGPKVPEGDVAATLTVPPLVGGFDPASIKGQPSLVLFVSPTCVHCMATIPSAMAAATKEHGNLVLVFVVGEAPQATSVVHNLRFTGPTLVDNGKLRQLFHIRSVPLIYVLGPDGRAADALEGEQTQLTLERALVAAHG